VIQTRKAKAGGVIQFSKNELRQNNIKFIHQNITYSQIHLKNLKIHIVSVYIPPYHDERAIPFINHLFWLIENIFEKDRHSKVLIAGDFNFHLKVIEPKLKNLGLHGIIPKG
jgi:exonuclease III